MKDNFNLKKFITENKTMESSNPYIKENEEDQVRTKIREALKEMNFMDYQSDVNPEDEMFNDGDSGNYVADSEEMHEDDLYEAKEDEEEVDPEMSEDEESEEGEEEVDVEVTDEEGGDVDAGASGDDVSELNSHLMQALDIARSSGDKKLIRQIANTIKFAMKQSMETEA